MRHGILLINKAEGWTSHDVVAKVRSLLHEKSIGHLGTLDPAAHGLLVLFVGKKALKTIELFHELSKEYEADILFGKRSSTYDREGVIEDVPEKPGFSIPPEAKMLEVLRTRFIGVIHQRPPAHSAVHICGERAYELARENPDIRIDMPEREVSVSSIQLLSYAYPHAKLRIACGSGTYIRSIANDLGEFLHAGAYLAGLRRTQIGPWLLRNAVTVENCSFANIIPLKDILSSFPRRDLTESEWLDVQHGKNIRCDVPSGPHIGWYEDLPVVIFEQCAEGAHPRKVL
ncbi:MAG TPA: tRNA pseudouridine(55) synthase TruB [Candidatus Peribacterales bacterium]|nr:tRNA pseudouridine(55) synthase TruB [Candidatus Peribacterales bacterium]